MSNRIKAVLFDVDGVIFNRDQAEKESLYSVLEKEFIAVPYDFLEKWKKSNSIVWAKCDNGDFTAEYAKYYRWQLLFQEYGISLTFDNAIRLSDMYYQLTCSKEYLVRDFQNILDLCQNSGLVMGIITNGFEYVQRNKLESCGVNHYFTEMFAENNTGYRKPDIRMFQSAIKTIKVEALETIYIGNSYEDDIIPALQVGMKPIWFDCNTRIAEENNDKNFQGIYVANDVSEVLKFIQKLMSQR